MPPVRGRQSRPSAEATLQPHKEVFKPAHPRAQGLEFSALLVVCNLYARKLLLQGQDLQLQAVKVSRHDTAAAHTF